MGAKVGEAGCFGAGLWGRVVGSIGVVVENHVAGKVFDDGIRVGGGIVQEVNASIGSGGSGAGLLGSNGAEGREHGVVDGTGIVEENTNNFTDTLDSGSVEGWGVVLGGHLHFGSILGSFKFVWAVGGLDVSVGKAGKSSGNIAGHGELNSASNIVPVKVETTELVAGPVDGDVIVFGEHRQEVVSIVLANILDAKVVDNEGKHDGFGGVAEQAGGVSSFNKAGREELAHELFVGKVRGLGQAVHAAVNADVNKTIVG